MRVILIAVAVAVAGCSGPGRARSPYVMMARAVPKMAKRLKGETNSVAAQPSVVITGNVVR